MSKSQWSESFAFIGYVESPEESQWQSRFITEVEKESPRGAVLTIVSFIDELLIKLLKGYFPNKEHGEKLLESLDGCLSTIMHRANVAYALALLREREYKAIKVLARIRNEFAHKWDGTDFNNKQIEKLVNSFPQKYFEYVEGTNRAKFNCVASKIVQELLTRVKYAENICIHLPKEYRDIFDMSDAERREYLRKN
ncbi:TPA: hypothetical protein NG573_004663 [Vibrio parahaemolyticus]|uniref:hypothetical protein n=1 Tax=Vibrio parahaemolyticus TaxID=670 RepID=UPI001E31D659|nr:hypothetical protein [Vibrio parahaemolyticus]HCE2128602.1 hypothetical protein [Vibrio parahaemolyticus]HCE3221240.1 hypothetical protein [Vibrio parahaemolyticus]HCM1502530.1 hypothetical protein [Vibrio parahaemolyticus]